MPKIMFVGDDENVMKLLSILFTAKCFGILKANMGSHVLEKIGTEAPDIILLDLNLNDMDGIDLLKRIKMEKKGTPVIILSVKDDVATKKEVIGLGAAAHFGKPFRPADLYEKVMQVLSN